MSEEEAKAFMKNYLKSNDVVAKKYIDDGNPLFNEKERYREKWEENDREILEEMIKITTKMFGEMQQEIENQKKMIEEFKKSTPMRQIICKLRKK